MTRCRLVLIALCSAAVATTGCGRRTQERIMEKAIEKETGKGAKVEINKDSFSVRTGKGEFNIAAGKAAKVPSDFPADVFVYKDASVEMSLQVPEGRTLTLKTRDAVAKVVAAYKREMTSKGWTQQAALEMEAQTVLNYEKDGRSAMVAVGSETGETKIMLTVAAGSKSGAATKTAKASKAKDDRDKSETTE